MVLDPFQQASLIEDSYRANTISLPRISCRSPHVMRPPASTLGQSSDRLGGTRRSTDFFGINSDRTTAGHPFHLIPESLEATATAVGVLHLPSPLGQYTFVKKQGKLNEVQAECGTGIW
jgi:hypothetical protein